MKAKEGRPDERMTPIQKSDVNQDEARATAIIAYITVIGLIIALVKNKDEKNAFAGFHIRQMLGICSIGLALLVLVPIFGLYFYSIGMLFVILLWVLGLINAVNGDKKKVFALGGYFQKWFKGI